MTIDIHKVIGKLPIIPKRGFTLPNYNYCGPYNPLNSQVIYNKNGNIIKYIQKPRGKTYEICAKHDIDYELSKNINDKHKADKRMIDSINKLPYKDKQWGSFLVKNIIHTKQFLGMGNNFTMEDLSEELNKPIIHKFKRKKTIFNYIDHVHSADLVDMKMYSKINKRYDYIFTNIEGGNCMVKAPVYQITCLLCMQKYIGESVRSAHDRHKHPNCNSYSEEAFAMHYKQQHPNTAPQLKFNILLSENNTIRRKILESFFINTIQPEINNKEECLVIKKFLV